MRQGRLLLVVLMAILMAIWLCGPVLASNENEGQNSKAAAKDHNGHKAEEKGPPLELSYERLRPEWTERWLANPKRLFPYDPIMPQNFPRVSKDKETLQELFDGSSIKQITALRDVLMNLPKIADLPGNRNYYWSTLGGSDATKK